MCIRIGWLILLDMNPKLSISVVKYVEKYNEDIMFYALIGRSECVVNRERTISCIAVSAVNTLIR